MDIIIEFTLMKSGPEIENFVVSGASKRGWTAWTTAIFDDRVIAVAPAVIVLLNITPSFLHHWRALGEWYHAFAVSSRYYTLDWFRPPVIACSFVSIVTYSSLYPPRTQFC